MKSPQHHPKKLETMETSEIWGNIIYTILQVYLFGTCYRGKFFDVEFGRIIPYISTILNIYLRLYLNISHTYPIQL